MSKLKMALEKAKQARGVDRESLIDESESLTAGSRTEIGRTPSAKRETRIYYTKTKVEPIDPQVLKKNKVVSLFQDSEASDRISILRTQVLKKLEEVHGNSLLITSANVSEGKTFTAINLALSMAQELSRTVLLVDTDLRKPHKTHFDFSRDFFGLDTSKGLSDYLLGEAEIPELLLNPGIRKLTILPGGRSMPNSAELLGSARMASMIKEMKSRYRDDRILILDGSALLTCADSLVLSRFVDGVLLVVEAERTSPAELKRVMELMKNIKILGAVMNKARGE